MKQVIKYIVFALLIGLSLYNAVYFESLDDHKRGQNKGVFDAKTLAIDFITSKTETLPAINVSEFLVNIADKINSYCENNGKKLGISNNYNFIIEGNATVTAIEDENILLVLNDDKEQHIRIATDFIFGNAIRDASAIADIGDFQNTMDFNSISVELNNIVRETVVPLLKQKVEEDDELYFKGAVEVNTKHPDLQHLKVIPLIIKFKK